jgi:hypothetical protein
MQSGKTVASLTRLMSVPALPRSRAFATVDGQQDGTDGISEIVEGDSKFSLS